MPERRDMLFALQAAAIRSWRPRKAIHHGQGIAAKIAAASGGWAGSQGPNGATMDVGLSVSRCSPGCVVTAAATRHCPSWRAAACSSAPRAASALSPGSSSAIGPVPAAGLYDQDGLSGTEPDTLASV
jgi:hypothetical protein